MTDQLWKRWLLGIFLVALLMVWTVPVMRHQNQQDAQRLQQEGLRLIDGAKRWYAINKEAADGTVVQKDDLVGEGESQWLEQFPTAPIGMRFVIHPLGTPAECVPAEDS